MKALHKYFFIAVLFAASCTKPEDNDPEPNPPTPPLTKAELILGKWNLVSIVRTEENGPGKFTVMGSPGDYMNFAEDSLYSNVRGMQQNAKYILHPNDSISFYYPPSNTIREEHMLIIKLTSNEMQIQGKAQEDIGVISLKK